MVPDAFLPLFYLWVDPAARCQWKAALSYWRPDLEHVGVPAEFVVELRRLKQWTGLTFRQLEARAAQAGDVLPHSTAVLALRRERLPREELVVAFVRACGRPSEEVERWVATRRRLALDEVAPDPAQPAAEPSALPSTRNYLPRDLPDFTGFTDQLAQLSASAGSEPVSFTIDGMAGAGKTALAVRAGYMLSGRFPDGVLFVDLQGFSGRKRSLTTVEALSVLLRHLDVRPSGELLPLWRAETKTRRLLVILDNALNEEQVAPLLPAGPCFTIVTSRARLQELDGCRPMTVPTMPDRDATALLARIVGTARADIEPEAVARVAKLCGNLPLALRLAGARLAHRPAWRVEELSRRLSDSGRRLAELSATCRGVSLAFQESYERLQPVEKTVFRALGRHPAAETDVRVVAAAAGLPLATSEAALHRLARVHMAEEHRFNRYRQHALLRQFARQLSADPMAS